MTITEYAAQLSAQIRAEGVDGPALPLALQLAVRLWLDIDRPADREAQWGLFAGDVHTVLDRLYPQPPETVVVLDPTEVGFLDECDTAIRQLIGAAADVLQAAGRQPDLARVWDYAAAGQRLRDALEHLP